MRRKQENSIKRIEILQILERKGNKRCRLMYVVEVWHLVEQREHVHVKAGDVLLPLI